MGWLTLGAVLVATVGLAAWQARRGGAAGAMRDVASKDAHTNKEMLDAAFNAPADRDGVVDRLRKHGF